MSDNSYEEYKRELSRSLKGKEDSRSGKICFFQLFYRTMPEM